MDRFVFYSKPKLVASLAPLLLIGPVLFWLGLEHGGLMALALAWSIMLLAILRHLSPFDGPKLELSSSALAYGPGLACKVLLSEIKYAKSGGSSPHGWLGSVNVWLEMEARASKGQLYFDRKVIQLFCVDTSPEYIAERINFLIQESKRHRSSPTQSTENSGSGQA
ncbi:hypothetical protein DBR47_06955 [Paucibacter sp. KBW04]|uniref:hypothetical protein n=1 Tax=Paucibacter sp. KBW04 TaxID=2153361 RepID=UPI000F55F08C|nr:hypothetical protein [Paucibacter sp. KBW04]RQO61855.1 hypothetical protein DBR47_06955 [Paucibacter sp. KBW04]